MHLVLVNRLGLSLLKKSVGRLDMTIVADWEVKQHTNKTNNEVADQTAWIHKLIHTCFVHIWHNRVFSSHSSVLTVYLACRYAARFDCGCRYRIEIELLNADRKVLDSYQFEDQKPPGRGWFQVTLLFENV